MRQAGLEETGGPYRSGTSVSARKTALRRGEYPIAVYGLGKIGLPVAVSLAELTGRVTGVDVDAEVVSAVNEGVAPFDHEPGLPDRLSAAVADDQLSATTASAEASRAATIHIVVVPVGRGDERGADLGALRAAAETIGEGLDPGDLVVLESTVPPGTAAEVLAPILRERSGLEPDAFGVAVAPERTASGTALRDIGGAYPRVVGGLDGPSTEAALVVYDELVDNRVISVDAETAELVKLFEGIYRDVNIALANELARACDGMDVDVREAIDAANTQPYCDLHRPGAGVGGHCIPWYPHFLLEATPHPMPLTRTAREVNDQMPEFLAARTLERLDEPTTATIAVLGLAYRAEVPETAASPTYPLVERLEAAGARAVVVDPIVDAGDDALEMCTLADLPDLEPDAIVLVTAHEAFQDLPQQLFEHAVIVDGRDGLGTDTPRDYVVGRNGA